MTDLADAPAYDLTVASPNAALDSYYVLSRLEVGDVHRAEKALHTAGGKGNNLARAVKALGGRGLSLGIVGGHTGRFIVDELEREGIPHAMAWTQHETRRSSTLIDLERRQTTVALDSGDRVDAEAAEGLVELVRTHAGQAPYLVLTGSLPPSLPASYYAGMIDRVLRSRPHPHVCLDCSGEVLRLAATRGVQLIKVNAGEFQASFGSAAAWHPRSGMDVFHGLQSHGLDVLIVTDGPRGAYVYSTGQPPFRVVTQVDGWISTAGAGDTFMAAWLLSLNRGASLEEAARSASAAAAATLQQIVCGSLDTGDLEWYRTKTRLEPLDL